MSYTYLEINYLHEEYSSQKVLLRNLMSRDSILNGQESAWGPDYLCSNPESATCQNLSTVFLSFVAYKMKIEIVPSS